MFAPASSVRRVEPPASRPVGPPRRGDRGVRDERVDRPDLKRRREVNRVERLEPDRPGHLPLWQRNRLVQLDELDEIRGSTASGPTGFMGNAGRQRAVLLIAPTLLVSRTALAFDKPAMHRRRTGLVHDEFHEGRCVNVHAAAHLRASSSRICWRISERVGAVGSIGGGGGGKSRGRPRAGVILPSLIIWSIFDSWAGLRGRNSGDRQAALGDLERTRAFFLHALQVDGQVLAKLPDTDPIWMLAFGHVAHGHADGAGLPIEVVRVVAQRARVALGRARVRRCRSSGSVRPPSDGCRSRARAPGTCAPPCGAGAPRRRPRRISTDSWVSPRFRSVLASWMRAARAVSGLRPASERSAIRARRLRPRARRNRRPESDVIEGNGVVG